ncbi:MAG: peptide deformylase [Candidatus Dadabacteria bacterium]|nr:peptide deformylase [Candidatus Dadabacteria bacterium]NIQ16739.1 peptide deformylase [Candidatus Dadabacteria bacterium]
MSILDILIYPDPRLRKKSKPVKKINDSIIELLENMAETMYNAPGVGLAAPQVGKNIRVITIDISSVEDEQRDLIELINPEIISSKGSQIGEEGCLSVPGFVSNVKRKMDIKVKSQNREGETIIYETSDLLSRVMQHEIDHLNGIYFFDRLARLKRELLVNKIKKEFVVNK